MGVMSWLRRGRESNGERLERYRTGSQRLRKRVKETRDTDTQKNLSRAADVLDESADQIVIRGKRVRRFAEVAAKRALTPASAAGVKTRPLATGVGEVAERVYYELPAPQTPQTP